MNSLGLPYHNNCSVMSITNQMYNMNLGNNVGSGVVQGNHLNNGA